jgi:microcystin-dependent protein
MNASDLSSTLINGDLINNIADSLLSNSTFINNFGDSLFLNQSFTDSLTAHIYNYGDTLLYNSDFINNLRDSIDTDVDSITLTGTLLTVYENGANASVNLSSLSDNDGDPTNELQTLTSSGSNVTLSNGGGSVSINDADSNPTNEHNTNITLTGNTLNIIDGGGTQSIDLTPLVNSAINQAETPSGAIFAFPTSTPPAGYLACNGQAVSRSTYASLFSLIGSSYGSGNGTTTFNLPNYNGEFLRGWDNGQGTDLDAATRTDRGDGTTGDVVGSKQANQTLAHNHTINPPATTSNSRGNHLHTIDPPSTNSNTTGNHGHTIDPPNTNTNTTGAHAHTVDPPNTATTTNGNHRHGPLNGNGYLNTGTNVGNNGTGYAYGTNPTTWGGVGSSGATGFAGNHNHTVNIAAFNSAANGNHAHSVNIAAFNSSTTGNHAHTTDISQFNSSTAGNHSHTTNIPQFNSGNNGGTETRPTNVSVLWCIKF